MQLINKQTYIWVPLIVLGGSLRHHPRGVRDPRELRVRRPDLRRRRAGAAVVLPRRRHPGAHAHVPVLAGDERDPARVLPRHAPHRGADLGDPRGHRGRRRARRDRHRRVGHERLVLRARPGSGRAARSAPFLFNFVVAMLFFVVGFWAATIYKRFGATVAHHRAGRRRRAVRPRAVGRRPARMRGRRCSTWFAEQGVVGLSLWGIVLGAVLAASRS